MNSVNICAFCDKSELDWRTIRSEKLFTSFVSSPWFRENHVLVIPNRHVMTIDELDDGEGAAIMKEIGRLGAALDTGFGSGVMQKYQPLQTENGIKVSHLHFHVFPRTKEEEHLFPTPIPNSFDGFITPQTQDVLALIAQLHDHHD